MLLSNLAQQLDFKVNGYTLFVAEENHWFRKEDCVHDLTVDRVGIFAEVSSIESLQEK